MTRSTKIKIADFLKSLNQPEWAKQLLDDHTATENSLTERNNKIIRLQSMVAYLQSRDLELIKKECYNMHNPELNDSQQNRYNLEVQEALRKTGKDSLSSMAFE